MPENLAENRTFYDNHGRLCLVTISLMVRKRIGRFPRCFSLFIGAKNPTSHHLKVLTCAWKHIEGCLPRLYRYWKQEWEDWILAFYLQYAQMEQMQRKQNLLMLLQIILSAVSLFSGGSMILLTSFHKGEGIRLEFGGWSLHASHC